MKEDILKAKSFAFAVRIVKLYKYLCEQKTEYVLSKQVFRSGTSVGAMVCEAEYSESKVEIIKTLTTSIKTVKNISH